MPSAIEGGDDDAARMKPSEIIASQKKGPASEESIADTGDDPNVRPQWSFPYVKAILGDQKAATNYFVTLPEPPVHEHEEKYNDEKEEEQRPAEQEKRQPA